MKDNKLTDAEIEELVKQLEKDMPAEAVERLKVVKLNNLELTKQFSQNGIVYLQDFSIRIEEKDRLCRANAAEMKAVHYMEDEQGNLPYFIVKREIEQTYRSLYDFLYVSYDKHNWFRERLAIEKRQRQQYGTLYRKPEVFEIETELISINEDDLVNALFKSFTTLKLDVDK